MNTDRPSRMLSSLRRTFVIALAGIAAPCFGQGTMDPDFNVGTGANNRVTSAVLQLDGKVLIGGNFTTYNSTTANHVARLNLDGSLDGAFAPTSGANLQVNSVALTSSGQAVIGGIFTSYDGTGRNRIARLNSDGTLDTGFDPGTGFNGLVTHLAVQSDDKVIVVGDFTSFNGTGRNRIARLNTDGTLDTGFDPGTGANSLVTTVEVQSDGKALIGGYFSDIDGTAVVALARLNSDGSLDTGYNSGGSGPNNAVDAISLQPDGKALIGGLFTTYNATGRNRIARLNTDGTLDTGFAPGSGANGEVLAIAQQSDGAIILGGSFTAYGGNTHNRHCRITGTGAEDATWATGCDNAINCLLWMPEGRLVVGGIFTHIAGNPRNRITRFKALCTDDVDLVITTDGAGSETGWELIPFGYQYAAYGGSGLPDNSVAQVGGCLALGCYELRVTDSGTNGITDGGYVLKSQSGERIIDDTANFSTGGLSQISGGQGGPVNFCVPIGTHKPIYTSRDKLDWVNNQFIVSSVNAAVSQVWTDYGAGSSERANSGYDMWFFDPNGGYSFVRQRRHSVSDGFGPASATRACHMQINNWPAVNHIPANTLMNVRMRTVVLGVASDWGPAYRFKIDALRAQCPLTKLMDDPTNPYLSCGQTRVWGPGNYVHARPVRGANKYQFRFRIPAEGFTAVRNSNTYILHLNWGINPLECGETYEVDVRTSFDGGTTWCSDYIPPALDPWGDVCLLTIASCFQGNEHRMELEEVEPGLEAGIVLWPNPNAGEALNLRIDGLEPVPQLLNLTVLDATGRIVHQESHAVNDTGWSGTVSFTQRIPAGAYAVLATAGEQRWTQRYVVR